MNKLHIIREIVLDIFTGFTDFLASYGAIGLGIWSFAESSFFPIPPDFFLINLILVHNKALAFWYALICTVFSVLGGMFGYFIGAKLGKPILHKFFKEEKINKVERYFQKYDAWAIIIAAFTPIPYKVFTISAGVFEVNFKRFVLASAIGRGARFFLVATLLFMFGDIAKYYILNYFDVITLGLVFFLFISYFIYRKAKKIGNSNNT